MMHELSEIKFSSFIRNTNDCALVIASFQPNLLASEILRVTLGSINKFNYVDTSVWVIDVGSGKKSHLVSPNEFKNFNFIYVDRIPEEKKCNFYLKFLSWIKKKNKGSYENGWMLEFAKKLFLKINYNPSFFMTLHMDVMFTNPETINKLRQKLLKKQYIACGVIDQMNLGNEYKILHPLGCMWNYNLFKKLNLNFMPKFPKFDVGEKAISVSLDKNFKIFAYENSRNDSFLLDRIHDKYKSLKSVDVCVDENNNVIFLHLGRGILKSSNKYKKNSFTTIDWINWYKNNL